MTHADMCAEVIDAGCVFVVTPVFVPAVIDACNLKGVYVVAGALTPTEIFMACEAGADVINVFPAKVMCRKFRLCRPVASPL
ncbi:MAG: hypothetical protein NTU74_19945 [Deltaproteobacteria bacterium]|nr:hypothetical protein [Deltaproteobacteria bacterium]